MPETSEIASNSESQGMRLLGYNELGQYGNGGEGISLYAANGRRYLFVAHERGPANFSVVDVSDPSKPELVCQPQLTTPGLRSNTLCVYGDMLAVGYQFPLDYVAEHGYSTNEGVVGVELFSLQDPHSPRSVGFFDTSGAHSIGTHFVWFLNDHQLFISTGMRDFLPSFHKDHQFPVILDVSNPAKPEEMGRWWLPGTRVGDDAPPPTRHAGIDSGFRSHNINIYPGRPDRAYVGYLDGGVVVLDVADPSRPKAVSILDYHPPMPGFTHTVVPFASRGYLVASDETVREHGGDHPKRVWVIDAHDESNLLPISTLPVPPLADFQERPGKFGPHNIHENDPSGTALVSESVVVAAYMNAGVRVFDLDNPFEPAEVSYFIPPAPAKSRFGTAIINDTYADENGIIYAIDRFGGGLYILEMDDFDLCQAGKR